MKTKNYNQFRNQRIHFMIMTFSVNFTSLNRREENRKFFFTRGAAPRSCTIGLVSFLKSDIRQFI